MENVVSFIKKQPFYALQGATDAEIAQAEQLLGLCFAPDYRSYVSAFGAASFAGHELTGVCKPQRLNVVAVTQEERIRNEGIPQDWYVVEQAHIDGIVIWQTPAGEIYQSVPGSPERRIFDSLLAYLMAFEV